MEIFVDQLVNWLEEHPEADELQVYGDKGKTPMKPQIVEVNGKFEVYIGFDK